MGCDIHYVVERKSKYSGWVGVFCTRSPFTNWQKHTDPIWLFKSRDYCFFANLAGVRGDDNTEYPEPKGTPRDVSTMALEHMERWGEDGHSHSYCSLHDFAITKLKSRGELGLITAKKLTDEDDPLYAYLGLDLDENLDEYRVIFWFDN